MTIPEALGILGINSERITFEEIKNSYRILAKKNHPDMFSNFREQEQAAKKFIEIDHAYKFLMAKNIEELNGTGVSPEMHQEKKSSEFILSFWSLIIVAWKKVSFSRKLIKALAIILLIAASIWAYINPNAKGIGGFFLMLFLEYFIFVLLLASIAMGIGITCFLYMLLIHFHWLLVTALSKAFQKNFFPRITSNSPWYLIISSAYFLMIIYVGGYVIFRFIRSTTVIPEMFFINGLYWVLPFCLILFILIFIGLLYEWVLFFRSRYFLKTNPSILDFHRLNS